MRRLDDREIDESEEPYDTSFSAWLTSSRPDSCVLFVCRCSGQQLNAVHCFRVVRVFRTYLFDNREKSERCEKHPLDLSALACRLVAGLRDLLFVCTQFVDAQISN